MQFLLAARSNDNISPTSFFLSLCSDRVLPLESRQSLSRSVWKTLTVSKIFTGLILWILNCLGQRWAGVHPQTFTHWCTVCEKRYRFDTREWFQPASRQDTTGMSRNHINSALELSSCFLLIHVVLGVFFKSGYWSSNYSNYSPLALIWSSLWWLTWRENNFLSNLKNKISLSAQPDTKRINKKNL